MALTKIWQHANVLKSPLTYPSMAGPVHRATVQYVISHALDVSDEFVEILGLPHDCDLVGARLTTVGITETATIDVGFITGTYGDYKDLTRTLGAQIVDDGAKNSTITLSPEALHAIGPSGVPRGIGFNWSADITGGAGKLITLEIDYRA